MGADAGAAGTGIVIPGGGQGFAQLGLRLDGRHAVEHRLDAAVEAHGGARERPHTGGYQGRQATQGGASRRRHGDPVLGHPGFQGGQPGGVALAIAQQPRAFPQGPFIDSQAGGMGRVEAEHQPVEKPPPRRRAIEEQAVHGRGQPQGAHHLGERRLAARRLAVDAQGPPRRSLRRRAGAERDRTAIAVELDGDAPARLRRRRAAAQVGERRGPQAAPGSHHGERLEQAGLARAIGPEQGDRALIEIQDNPGETAKIRDREPLDGEGGQGFRGHPVLHGGAWQTHPHTRMGIST